MESAGQRHKPLVHARAIGKTPSMDPRTNAGRTRVARPLAALVALGALACDGDDAEVAAADAAAQDARAADVAPHECQAPAGDGELDFLQAIGCRMDFDRLASEPL